MKIDIKDGFYVETLLDEESSKIKVSIFIEEECITFRSFHCCELDRGIRWALDEICQIKKQFRRANPSQKKLRWWNKLWEIK